MILDMEFEELNSEMDVEFSEELHITGSAEDHVIEMLEVTENGRYVAPDGVSGYSPVVVNVPIPDGYIKPSGTKDIIANGEYDVTDKANVVVSVPDRDIILQDIEVTENGSYSAAEGYDGIGTVNVNVAASGGDPNLPAGYSRVDYIQFTGEQTIDTGIICNQETKLQVMFTRELSTQHYLYGVASEDNTASVTAYLGGSWRFGNKSVTKQITTYREEILYSAIVDRSEISVNNGASTISGVNDFETIGSLLLGSCRGSSGSVGAPQYKGKVAAFVMWQGEEQVLKLEPVVSNDGVYRFFDTVSQAFFDSITDTPLSGGNF